MITSLFSRTKKLNFGFLLYLTPNSVIAVNGDENIDLENTQQESLQAVTHLS